MFEHAYVFASMREAAKDFTGKASPSTQQEIVNHLLGSGFTMGQIADNLYQLMLHLGHADAELSQAL